MSQNKGQNQNSKSNRRRKKSRKKPKMDPAKYWGDSKTLPARDDYTINVADPTAVIRSLGKAPIPGKQSAPELYFDVLYQRAAGLAKALAFAGGLNEGDNMPSAVADAPGADTSTTADNGHSDTHTSDT